MLRTCMGTGESGSKKETVRHDQAGPSTSADAYPPHPPPNYRSAMAGGVAAAGASSSAGAVGGAAGGSNGVDRVFDNGDIFSAKKADEFREALADVFPEDIPGLPRHRPGHYSSR